MKPRQTERIMKKIYRVRGGGRVLKFTRLEAAYAEAATRNGAVVEHLRGDGLWSPVTA